MIAISCTRRVLWARKHGFRVASPLRLTLVVFAAVGVVGCAREPTAAELAPPVEWRYVAVAAEHARAAAAQSARVITDRTASLLKGATAPPQTAPALAAAIAFSRDQARGAGVKRPPVHVREALEPYFDESILDEVRWTLAGRRVSLGSFLAGWYLSEGGVTLEDVVVFSNRKAADSVWLWAHELTHVEQYRRLGVSGFSREYLANWRGLEEEATARAHAVTAQIRAETARRKAKTEALESVPQAEVEDPAGEAQPATPPLTQPPEGTGEERQPPG